MPRKSKPTICPTSLTQKSKPKVAAPSKVCGVRDAGNATKTDNPGMPKAAEMLAIGDAPPRKKQKVQAWPILSANDFTVCRGKCTARGVAANIRKYLEMMRVMFGQVYNSPLVDPQTGTVNGSVRYKRKRLVWSEVVARAPLYYQAKFEGEKYAGKCIFSHLLDHSPAEGRSQDRTLALLYRVMADGPGTLAIPQGLPTAAASSALLSAAALDPLPEEENEAMGE